MLTASQFVPCFTQIPHPLAWNQWKTRTTLLLIQDLCLRFRADGSLYDKEKGVQGTNDTRVSCCWQLNLRWMHRLCYFPVCGCALHPHAKVQKEVRVCLFRVDPLRDLLKDLGQTPLVTSLNHCLWFSSVKGLGSRKF